MPTALAHELGHALGLLEVHLERAINKIRVEDALINNPSIFATDTVELDKRNLMWDGALSQKETWLTDDQCLRAFLTARGHQALDPSTPD